MEQDDIEARKLDLEQRRLDADTEIRQVELAERRCDREAETERHKLDAENKRLELSISEGKGIKFTTAQATVAAGVLALVSAIVGGAIQAWVTRDVEASKSLALIEIERVKATANIDLERQKQDAAERLDRAKFESTLILKATESPKREEQVRNLKFFLNAGFIRDPDSKIANMEVGDYPSAPPPVALSPTTLTAVSDLARDSLVREIARPVGLLSMGGPRCTGWLIGASYVVTAARCVEGVSMAGAPPNMEFTLGYLSLEERGESFKVKNVVEIDKAVGYAILEIDPPAGSKYGRLRLSERPPEIGEQILILQHANGGVLRASGSDCIVTGTHVDLLDYALHNAFSYRCSTAPGSSGAPVVALRDLVVLGINEAGSTSGVDFGIMMRTILSKSKLTRSLISRSNP
jgi:hypothetical protein